MSLFTAVPPYRIEQAAVQASARAYFGLKLYASAIDDLTEDLKRKPGDAEALENRGLAYFAIDASESGARC